MAQSIANLFFSWTAHGEHSLAINNASHLSPPLVTRTARCQRQGKSTFALHLLDAMVFNLKFEFVSSIIVTSPKFLPFRPDLGARACESRRGILSKRFGRGKRTTRERPLRTPKFNAVSTRQDLKRIQNIGTCLVCLVPGGGASARAKRRGRRRDGGPQGRRAHTAEDGRAPSRIMWNECTNFKNKRLFETAVGVWKRSRSFFLPHPKMIRARLPWIIAICSEEMHGGRPWAGDRRKPSKVR